MDLPIRDRTSRDGAGFVVRRGGARYPCLRSPCCSSSRGAISRSCLPPRSPWCKCSYGESSTTVSCFGWNATRRGWGSSGRPPVPARAAIRARRCRRPCRGSGGAVLVVRRRRRGSPHRDGARETAGRRHALLGEDGGCRAVLDRPAPTIDADPELVALRRTLDDARNELSAVRSGLLCELDGTCGTKQDGAGSIYRAKRELSDQLQKRVEVELPEKIASRTSAVHGQIESDRAGKGRRRNPAR